VCSFEDYFGPHREAGDGGRAAHWQCSWSRRQWHWGSSRVSRGGKRECQELCGEAVLLGEPFVGPVKGSSGARRVVTGEETIGNYGF
jgi:hypothetical protein